MTFEEFWNAQDAKFKNNNLREQIHDVWVAATNAAREACIAAIDAADDCGCGVPCDCFGAGGAIAAIKALDKL